MAAGPMARAGRPLQKAGSLDLQEMTKEFQRAVMTSSLSLFGSEETADDSERLEESHELRSSFRSTLESHPPMRDGLEWPPLIPEDVNVGPAFCIDAVVDEQGECRIAVGYNSGEVQCSPLRPSKFVEDVLRDAAAWPVVYKHGGRVISLSISPSGSYLASSSWDGTVVLFDFETRRAVHSMKMGADHFSEFPALPHGICTCQVAWGEDEHLAVAVSRVRKFQGQTNPARIPGGLVVGECWALCEGDTTIPDAMTLFNSMTLGAAGNTITVPHIFDNGTDTELPAVWCTSIASVAATSEMDLSRHPVVLKACGQPSPKGRFAHLRKSASRQFASSAAPSVRRSAGGSRFAPSDMPASSCLASSRLTAAEDPPLLVASGCGDATVRLFAVVYGTIVQISKLAGHNVVSTNGGIWDVCFLPKVGTATICTGAKCSSAAHSTCMLASAGEDNDIRVWDCANQCCLLVLSQGSSQGFGVLRIRPYIDRKSQYSKNWDVINNVFHDLTATGRTSVATRSMTLGTLSSTSESWSDTMPTRERTVQKLMLLAANWDNSLRLWDVESASPHSVFTNVHADAVWDVVPIVVLTARGLDQASCLRCMTVSRDRTLKLWNYEVGTAEQISSTHKGAVVGILQLPFTSATGKELFLSASDDGLVTINDYSTRRPSFTDVPCPKKRLLCLAEQVGPEGQVAFGDDAGEVHIYRPRMDQDERLTLGPKCCVLPHDKQGKPGVHEVVCIGWLKRDVNDTLIVVSCYCGHVAIWREGHSEPLHSQTMKSAQHAVCCLDGTTLPAEEPSVTFVTGGDKDVSGVISIWSVNRRGLLVEPEHVGSLHGHQDRVLAFALGPQGIHLASTGFDSTILVWHMPSRSLIRSLRHHSGSVRSLWFRPFSNGSLLISASEDKKILVWQVGCAKVQNIFLGHRFAIRAMSVSNCGRYLLTGDTGGQVMRRSLDSSAMSLLVVWRCFLQLSEELRTGGIGRAEEVKELFKTFVGPPSLVLQNTLFPFRFTLLHFFAMIGDANAIRLCFEAARHSSAASSLPVGFKRDSENLSPIDWAVACDHMDCADELLRQAAKYPWQMGLILAPSIPGILCRIAQHGWKLKHFPHFLDSRLFSPQPGHGLPLMIPMSTRNFPRTVVQGVSCPSLTMEEYAHLYKVRVEDMSPSVNAKSCNARVLYIPGFIPAIMELQQKQGITPGSMDDATLQCEAWEVLTSYIWDWKYFHLYLVYLCSYTFHLCFGLYYLILLRTYQNERNVFQKWICGAFVFLVNGQLFCAEMAQLKSEGFREYLSDKFNYLQLFTYVVFLICVVCDFGGLFDDAMPVFASILSLSGVFNLLCVTRGFLEFGIVVRMFFEVIFALRYFLLVVLVVMSGFIISITLLADFHNNESGESNWAEFLFALLQVGLLGEYQGGLLMESVSQRISFVMAVEYWLFTFLLMIVLLNLLIAVMNNQFETLRKQSVIEAKKGRYEVMGDLDTSQVSQIVVNGIRRIILGRSGFVYPTYVVVFGGSARASVSSQRAQVSEDRPESGDRPNERKFTQELDMRIASLVVSHLNEFRQISSMQQPNRAAGPTTLPVPKDKKELAEYTRSVVIRTIDDLASRNMLHPDVLKGPLTWAADSVAREESHMSLSRSLSSPSRKPREASSSELVPLLSERSDKSAQKEQRAPIVEI